MPFTTWGNSYANDGVLFVSHRNKNYRFMLSLRVFTKVERLRNHALIEASHSTGAPFKGILKLVKGKRKEIET